MKDRGKVRIGSIGIDNLSWPEAVERVEKLMLSGNNPYALTPNVDHVVLAWSDPVFFKVYQEADLVLADGMPLLWAARFLRTPLKDKISGSDFLVRFCPVAAQKGYRLFFLGGGGDAATVSAQLLSRRYPGLKVVGVYSPPVGFELSPEGNARAREEISQAEPDLVFIGLGTPKQEKWIFENRKLYRSRMSFPVGAGFDFVSGKSRRAPFWMQQAGLEWFWRMLREPRRLGERYLIRDMQFFPIIWRQKRLKKIIAGGWEPKR